MKLSHSKVPASTTRPAIGLKAGSSSHVQDDTPAVPGVLGYFITFRCYGTWLHGDRRGSVDRQHRAYRSPLLERDQERERREVEALKHSAVLLDERRRMIVELTIREVAEHRTWIVYALAVRSNHVHVVVTAEITPENVMNSFKSWATRRMVEAGTLPKGTRPDHGTEAPAISGHQQH